MINRWKKGILIFTCLFSYNTILSTNTAFAEPPYASGSSTSTEEENKKVNRKPVIEPTYALTHNSVRVQYKVKDSFQWFNNLQNYSAKHFLEKLKGMPGLENIQFVPGQHATGQKGTSKLADVSLRNSALMVRVQGAAPFTMMFKVEEKLRRCPDMVKSGEEEVNMDKWESIAWLESLEGYKAPCNQLETGFVLQGPIAVYGTVPGNFSNKFLMMNQIYFSWRMKVSTNKRDTEVYSLFRIERPDFPMALQKLVKWVSGRDLMSEAASLPLADYAFADPTRNTLTQVGRVLAQKNQEILKGL